MVTVLIAVAVALLIACVVLLKARRVDPDQLFEKRFEPLIMGVQIICANCSGDAYEPHRTFLDRGGHCSQCGGETYLLNSVVAAHRLQTLSERVTEEAPSSSGRRVVQFRALASRKSNPEKIAV